MVVVYFFHFNMKDGLIHFNMLYSYSPLLGSAGQHQSSLLRCLVHFELCWRRRRTISSEWDKQNSRGVEFPRGFLPLLLHQPGRSPSNVRRAANQRDQLGACPVSMLYWCFSPRWHCFISFTKPLLIYLPQKENISFVASNFSLFFLFEKVKKVYMYKIWKSPSKKHISLVVIMQVWFPKKVEKKKGRILT